ncbi:MAG TPA: L-ribulose-5-phosphate 4-epimerase [Erysipelotrichaceae bacterium]|nr:L-ribulose-5-phosphate 4-epimerase [Erysipelotrichaceae bacterium]
MLEELKEIVYKANMELKNQGLIKYTWGNVSAVSRKDGLFVIKPSGVDYDELSPSNMVVCDFEGNVVEGEMRPSSDTLTHAKLYKNYDEIGAIVHTHSPWATVWAQAGLDVPVYGTTHADTFYGEIPCARFLTKEEIDSGYEKATGKVIIETFKERNINIMDIPAVILHGHGPFAWAKKPMEAVKNAVILEEICKMNYYTVQLNEKSKKLPQEILDKHYLRKHGKDAYYGQGKGK